jgi:hypothetical protein
MIAQGKNPKEGILLMMKRLFERKLDWNTEHPGIDKQIEPGRGGNRMGFALSRLNEIFPDPIFPTDEVLHQDYASIFCWVASDYVPGLYPGKSKFFFTRDRLKKGEDVGWRKVAEANDNEVEAHVIPGTHSTCRTKYLHDLAERLRMCLSTVQAIE